MTRKLLEFPSQRSSFGLESPMEELGVVLMKSGQGLTDSGEGEALAELRGQSTLSRDP